MFERRFVGFWRDLGTVFAACKYSNGLREAQAKILAGARMITGMCLRQTHIQTDKGSVVVERWRP